MLTRPGDSDITYERTSDLLSTDLTRLDLVKLEIEMAAPGSSFLNDLNYETSEFFLKSAIWCLGFRYLIIYTFCLLSESFTFGPPRFRSFNHTSWPVVD